MANPWVKLTGIQKRAAQKLRVAGGSSFYDEVALQLRVMGYGNCNPDKIESEMTKLGIEAWGWTRASAWRSRTGIGLNSRRNIKRSPARCLRCRNGTTGSGEDGLGT